MIIDSLEAFLKHTTERPNHPAVFEKGRAISYSELGSKAKRFASAVSACANAPRVLIVCAAGSEAYAAMFGTLMAGGFYAPVNVSAPVAKQRLIFERFQPDVIVAETETARALLGENTKLHIIDPRSLPEEELKTPRPAHDLAYVIFTSGSTGVPKGVMIPRSALSHYTHWAIEAMSISPQDRWSQHPNIGFDLSVLDIYGALCGGATLYPLSEAEGKLAPGHFIRRHELTIWNSVPSVVEVLLRGNQLTSENLASLRLITFCGEPLLPNHLEAIFKAHPNAVVHNTYGPTEATVSCTLLRLNADNFHKACAASVAIGEAIDGVGIHLIGGETQDAGEIVITGTQTARGYWEDQQATDRSFRMVNTSNGEVMGFYTGDWAERRNGQTYFKSRIDFQVKINGYRVELDEINSAIRRCGAAAACAVLIDGELHAFIEPGANTLEVAPLRAALSKTLDSYAVPRWYHFMDELPRSANDKTDVKALIESLRRSSS